MKYMAAQNYNLRKAFTLVEVLVSAIAAVILVVGISAMLFYGQRGYNTMYRRVHSEVVRNAYEARKVFDAYLIISAEVVSVTSTGASIPEYIKRSLSAA